MALGNFTPEIVMENLMMADQMVVEGNVAFAYLTEPDTYMGNDKYSVTVSLSDESQEALKKMGVKLKEYTDKNGVTYIQREFKRKAKYDAPLCFDSEGNRIGADAIGWGDTVRLAVSIGEGNALGRGTYLNKVKLLKKAERVEGEGPTDASGGDF
jgi:hypothetical protein